MHHREAITKVFANAILQHKITIPFIVQPTKLQYHAVSHKIYLAHQAKLRLKRLASSMKLNPQPGLMRINQKKNDNHPYFITSPHTRSHNNTPRLANLNLTNAHHIHGVRRWPIQIQHSMDDIKIHPLISSKTRVPELEIATVGWIHTPMGLRMHKTPRGESVRGIIRGDSDLKHLHLLITEVVCVVFMGFLARNCKNRRGKLIKRNGQWNEGSILAGKTGMIISNRKKVMGVRGRNV
ncbi:hypothetical protein NPIL_459861 [Nephila pilipes]|uniref:Uncharacterized protein n=1 Tax=Nephila pilipes TaxID=299642 RepID=A0A8X6QWD1_NEPPI|nr:hypothetical protein NPIL_459861 [Nephila pilipes]